jgi:hypothetical protein
MGAIEEGGKVATSVIEGLKTNPSCLAALAVVALFGLLNFFEDSRQNDRMMARAADVNNLLKECLDSNRDQQTTRSIPGHLLDRIPANPKPEDLP